MAEDDSSGTPSYAFGSGGDPYGSGMGLMALMGGGRGMGTDPYLAMLQPQMQYAQGLMAHAADASPVASPWQAAARAVSGILGGLGMRQYGQQANQTIDWEAKQAGDIGQRARDIYGSLQPGAQGPGAAPTAGGGTRQPGSGREQSASAETLAALPEVKALPAEIQGPLVQSMVSAKLGPNEGAHFARMVKQESGGQHYNASGNGLLTSSTGALGAGQLMPPTFAEMQKKYGISGDISDPLANLTAGAHYYGEGLDATNGDRAGAAVRYNGGPDALQTYLRGGTLKPETARYLIATNATSAPMPTAQGDSGGAPQATGSGLEAAMRMRDLALQAYASPIPRVQQMGPVLMAQAMQLQNINAWQPRMAFGNVPYSVNTATGDIKWGPQPSAETVQTQDLNTLTTLGPKVANGTATAEEAKQYGISYQRVGAPSYQEDPRTHSLTLLPSTKLPPGLPVPAGASGAAQDGTAKPPTVGTLPGTSIAALTEQANKETTEANAGLDKATEASRAQLGELQRIRSMLPHVGTGKGADWLLGAGQLMQRFGYSDKQVENITGIDPSKAEITGKALFDLLAQKVKDEGGVRAQAIFRMFQNALPSLESRPETIDTLTRIYEAGLRADQKYQQDRYDYLSGQRQEFLRNPDKGYAGIGDFNRKWLEANDPRIWNAAAMAAGKQPNDIWHKGLSDPEGNAAVALARSWWPGTPIYSSDGQLRAPAGTQ